MVAAREFGTVRTKAVRHVIWSRGAYLTHVQARDTCILREHEQAFAAYLPQPVHMLYALDAHRCPPGPTERRPLIDLYIERVNTRGDGIGNVQKEARAWLARSA